MQETATVEATLFVHTLRPQWGFAILTEESPEKRRYLFQDGQTRQFQEQYFHMMQPADTSSEDVRRASLRLQARLDASEDERSVLAKGQMDAAPLDAQIAEFQALYPTGFTDPEYILAHRAGAAGKRLKRHVDGATADAQATLSKEALGALVEESNWTEIHARASAVVLSTSLCTPKQRKAVTDIPADRHVDFARALWELLHGDAPSQERFAHFASVLKQQADASWTLATIFPGLVFPEEHVVVEAWPFAKNARRMEPQLVVGTSPNATIYESLRGMALRLSGELTEHGMPPRDLLDVHTFIVETTAPKRPKPAAKPTRH